MNFRIRGLDPAPFLPLYGLDDAALRRRRARRCIVDAPHAYPERIELRDAEPGETLLLLNYEHQSADTPYRAAHAIYVREGASVPHEYCDEVPEVMQRRPISLRAFDAAGEMVEADLCDGRALAPLIRRFLAAPRVAYLHAHYARYGCFAARIERAMA